MTAALRHPIGPALVALLLHAGLIAGYLKSPKCNNDISALVCVAQERVGHEPYDHIHVGFESNGFDGQFYYAIARNPWRRHDAAEIDNPACRHIRLLYPAVCWLLTGGDPELLLWVMPAVNLLAIAGIAGLGAVVALRFGRNAWWGLLLPLAVNAGMPALRDLTDPLATFTVVLLLTAWLCQWSVGWMTLAAMLAVLCREQNVGIVGIVMLLAIGGRDWSRAAGALVAILLFGGWAYAVWQAYGAPPFFDGNFGLPLEGIRQRLQEPMGHSAHLPIHLIGLSCLGVELLGCLLMPLFRPSWTALLVGWAGVALAVMASYAIYAGTYSYLRVFPWVPLALWLWAIQSGRYWPFVLTLPLVPWSGLAVAQAWKLV
jgi:hypothetical protein